jgi:hypothetical protein
MEIFVPRFCPTISPLQRFGFVAAIAVAGLMPSVSPAAADNPFRTLAGTWNGGGTAQFEGGKKESLRCKGYYTNASSNALGLSVRCANASAKVELRANLNYANGQVTGTWEERTYNQSGTISGRATSSRMNLAISGGIDGSLSVSVGKSSHSVVVSTAQSAFKGINISMSR